MRVATVCSALILASACGAGDDLAELPTGAEGEVAAIVVSTRPALQVELQPTVEAVGTASPLRAAELGPQMSARIESILIAEGDEVEAGAVLARLDTRVVSLGASRARSTADGADAEVRRLERDLERLRPLAERGSIPSAQVEQLELGLHTARAQAAAARSGAAEARTTASQGAVIAPFAGVIAEVPMEVGETATMMPPSTIVRLVDLSAVEIRARIPERELGRVRVGAPVSVRFPALADEDFEGTIARIAPEVDRQTRTVEVVVRVDNEGRQLRGGMSAELSIRPGAPRQAIVIPDDAARGLGATRRVFVVEEGHARSREIRVAPLSGGRLEVVEGLEEGDEVVSPLPASLRDGTAVRTREPVAEAS